MARPRIVKPTEAKKKGKGRPDLLPATKADLTRFRQSAAILMAKGYNVNDIAQMGGQGDRNKEKRLAKKLNQLLIHDPEMKTAVMEMTQAILVAALPKAAAALAERVEAGRPDAVKLLFELSGAYNPRVQHEHSGAIEIKMTGVPRPKRVEDEDAEFVDAEVVEET